ncbi:MAG: Beta-barrel assembly-enhancing protease [Pseudomonadota bacterium]|jgi:Flp pilus assembly protein TadD
MKTRTKKLLIAAGILAVVGVPAGLAVIIFPDNPLVRLFRAPVEATEGVKLVTGPYPLEKDFQKLRSEGVTTIVSLLNPAIPYEGILLERERALAQRFGMEVKNFPMSSILGQRFGADYDRNSAAAAQAVLDAPGKVYLHCYLGLHRAQAVFDRLGRSEGVAALRRRDPIRSPDALLSDAAEAAYVQGDYAKALTILDNATTSSLDLTQLRGWTLYKLGRFEDSAQVFGQTLQTDPLHLDALTGRGYALMQAKQLPAAEADLRKVIAKAPDRAEAWTGLGITLYRAERRDEALQALEKALTLDPANGDAREVLARLR